MLKLLAVRGAIITTDANGCTHDVAQAVLDAGADYLLALKGNRAALHAAVAAVFETAGSGGRTAGACADYDLTAERGHGRVEFRQVWTLPARVLGVAAPTLPGLQTLVHVARTRGVAGRGTTDHVYYVTSMAAPARRLNVAIRAHWGVENHLHHALDVVLGEDASRVRDKTAADNLGSIRRIAQTLLRNDPSKLSLAMKSRRAGLSSAYLRHLLTLGHRS